MKNNTIGIMVVSLLALITLFLTYSMLSVSTLDQALRYAQSKNLEDKAAYQKYRALYQTEVALGKSIEPKMHAVVAQCFSNCEKRHADVDLLCKILASDVG